MKNKNTIIDDSWLDSKLQDRFCKYVKIHTTSDSGAESIPSTRGQWELAYLLVEELKELGVKDITLTDNCFIVAKIPGNSPNKKVPTIGFMAHLDTSEDSPGNHVKPTLHTDYDGTPIKLENSLTLDPAEHPELKRYIGETVITSDGTTLLGADDKAGIAEIMTAVEWLKNTSFPHGDIEVIFTADEETGKGMKAFPKEQVKSTICFTMDGGKEDSIEIECYNAFKVRADFTGKVIHPGYARGKLVNAVSMAAAFITMIPRNESPEATDGKYGNYWPMNIKGNLGNATVDIFVRDHDLKEARRRLDGLHHFAAATESAFPGGKVTLTEEKQYLNMLPQIEKHSHLIEILEQAVEQTGSKAQLLSIRGGTDGAQLTEMGIPTPNIFAGGHNFHSPKEWIAVPAMRRATRVIMNIIKLFEKT